MVTKLLDKLKSYIIPLLFKFARWKGSVIGEPNVHFVHSGIGFVISCILLFTVHSILLLSLLMAGQIGAYYGVEFWYDKTYEAQSLADNIHDFMDYCLGISVAINAYVAVHYLLKVV